MCTLWLKYVTLKRKDQLKNMNDTTVEVAMLADVSGPYSVISSVYQCKIGPLRHEPSSLLLDELYSDWSTKR